MDRETREAIQEAAQSSHAQAVVLDPKDALSLLAALEEAEADRDWLAEQSAAAYLSLSFGSKSDWAEPRRWLQAAREATCKKSTDQS